MKKDKIDKWGDELEGRILRWVQTETIFNFLRYTPGRVLLAITSIGILYGYGWISLNSGGRHVWIYPIAIFAITLIQKISVRFAFDDDSIIDEFQHKRRNRAYRRAYKRVGGILITIVLLASWQFILLELARLLNLKDEYVLPLSPLEFHMSFEKAMVLGSFLIGLFVLQKYLSWGLKGEPRT